MTFSSFDVGLRGANTSGCRWDGQSYRRDSPGLAVAFRVLTTTTLLRADGCCRDNSCSLSKRSSHERFSTLRRVSTQRSDIPPGLPHLTSRRPRPSRHRAVVLDVFFRSAPTHHISGGNALGLHVFRAFSSRVAAVTRRHMLPLVLFLPSLRRNAFPGRSFRDVSIARIRHPPAVRFRHCDGPMLS
jgi:hypothetical protein